MNCAAMVSTGLVVVLVTLAILGRGRAECGGTLTAERGFFHTPNFPGPFPVPATCRWIIDSSSQPEGVAIILYLTQLYVSTGLTFKEFGYYEPDSPLQLDGLLLHSVNENNVVSVQWLWTKRNYFVVELDLDRLEGNHLRVLDDLLDVYGFNITYEMVAAEDSEAPSVKNDSCSVVGCSLAGNCYAANDYSYFWCSCFKGFLGPDCSQGPLCRPDTNVCRNGASCSTPISEPAQPSGNCPHQFGYYRVGDENHCGQFMICSNGISHIFDCPEGLAFNEYSLRCEWPDEVPNCNAEAYLGFACPNPGVTDFNPSGYTFYRSPATCQKYFLCINGRPRLLSCSQDEAFNELTSSCDAPENVTGCAIPERPQKFNTQEGFNVQNQPFFSG